MGVPKFYRWISERYPCLSEVIKEYQIPEFDNLYLDMNGIIHVCSHPNDDDPHFRISEEKIFADICHYLDFLFKMIKPQKVFFMAVDGVAPRAKMNQQRGRRFRTARSAEVMEEKAKACGEILPQEARFDSNCITPGTVFMARLHEILKSFVTFKVSTDKLWQNVKVYLSGHETPGEGEHKIMDFIRHEKSQDSYDPNTRHCLYGLDADLIMLGLSSHEPHFSLLREEVRFGKNQNQKRTVAPEETTFHLLHLSLLREYLGHEFGPVQKLIDFDFSLESIIDDFVLMSFLVGNDFIPHLPQLHIHHNALPILFKTYMDVLPKMGGYLNEGGDLNLSRFQMFFEKLAEFDYEKFGELSDFPPPGNKSKINYDETEEKINDLDKLADLGFSDLSLSKITEYDTSSEEDDDGADFELEFSMHKRDYYRSKLEYDNVTDDVLRDQAEGYVTAIQWNLHYYYNGIASWSWYYPHHYAPYISDIKNFKDMKIEFEIGEPFMPFQQLLAVLPAQSKNLLPVSYQKLMCDDDSPLKHYYPEDFTTDLNGKQQEWEAVVLIPFINEDLLLKCIEEADKMLNAAEKLRNQHGPHLLYTYTKKSGGRCESFLPGYFPPLLSNHAKCQSLDKDIFRLPADKIRKGLCPGVQLDIHFPGFPTLKHIQHTAKLSNDDVKVFQMVSQRDNMILTITEPVESDLKKVADSLIGKSCYVGWPHLQEAFVTGVSSEDFSYVLKGSKIESCPTNTNLWISQAKSVIEHYHRRFGIIVSEVENQILVHARNIIGSRLVSQGGLKVIEEKQWTHTVGNYPLQTTVKDITVFSIEGKGLKTHEELFPLNSAVFLLGKVHYGCMGTVISNDLKKNKGFVIVSVEVRKEPDFSSVIQNKDKLVSQKYRPGYELAKRLGISGYFLSRITGTFLVQTNSKESISPNTVNVGLNLKFNRKNEEVAGFSKKNEFNEWVYSDQVLETLTSYIIEFPEFFEKLRLYAKQDVVYLEDMYPEGKGNEVVSRVSKWLKSLDCYSAGRQMCGLNTLDEGIVFEIENLVKRNNFSQVKNEKMLVNPKDLYSPYLCKGCILPDPTATFEIFDRVVNVRHNLAVPLGLRGTVIGIRTADRICDYIYEVVFDEEFFGGLTLHCSDRKGYRLPPSALINLTYGERALKPQRSPKKIQKSSTASDDFKQLQKHQSHSPAKGNVSKRLEENGKNGLPRAPVQIFKKAIHESSSMPFYKMDAVISSKLDQPANFNLMPSSVDTRTPPTNFSMPSTSVNAKISPCNQFVTPKASPVTGNRTAHRSPKNNAGNEPPADYQNVWSNLIKSNSNSPSKKPSSHNYGMPVSVHELFNAVNTQSQTNVSVQQPSATPHHNHRAPPKPSAVLELMNQCTSKFGSSPTYTYQELGMTQLYISKVTLPDGRSFTSAQFPSQAEASENAAEQALIQLRQSPLIRSVDSQQSNYYIDNAGAFLNDMFSYYPPTFSGMDIRNPMVPSFTPPSPRSFVPAYNPLSVLRHQSVQSPMIPDSLVKQNQRILSGALPVQQFISPPVPPSLPQFVMPSPVSSLVFEEGKSSALKESMFVPLQVLKNKTKANLEDSAPVDIEKDWPSLPSQEPTPERAKKSDSSDVNMNSAGVVSSRTCAQDSLTSVAAQSMSTKGRPPRKPRLAANFGNKPS